MAARESRARSETAGDGAACGGKVRLGDNPSRQLDPFQRGPGKLRRATAFVLLFFVVEMVGGIWSGSLAVMSDAAHHLGDVSVFVLAIVANEIAGQPASELLTYGPVRVEVLSAIFSTVLLLALSFSLVYSVVCRIYGMWRSEAEEINGKLMSLIAFVGLLVNLTLLGWGVGDYNRGKGGSIRQCNLLLSVDNDDNSAARSTTVFVIFAHDADLGNDDGHRHGHGHGRRGHKNHREHGSLHIDDEEQGETVAVSSALNTEEERGLLKVPIDSDAFIPYRSEHCGSMGLSAVDSFQQNDAKQEDDSRSSSVEEAITDVIQSLGMLLAGLLIWYNPRWRWADPISTLFCIYNVVNQTRTVLTRAFKVLLEGVPETVNSERLRNRLAAIPGLTPEVSLPSKLRQPPFDDGRRPSGAFDIQATVMKNVPHEREVVIGNEGKHYSFIVEVTNIHCLHVWSSTTGKAVMSVHMKATNPERVLPEVHNVCEELGIEHSTIQVQIDCCAPLTYTHPCVSNVSACCESNANIMYADGQPTPPPV